jgi:hypothetical protein
MMLWALARSAIELPSQLLQLTSLKRDLSAAKLDSFRVGE